MAARTAHGAQGSLRLDVRRRMDLAGFVSYVIRDEVGVCGFVIDGAWRSAMAFENGVCRCCIQEADRRGMVFGIGLCHYRIQGALGDRDVGGLRSRIDLGRRQGYRLRNGTTDDTASALG